MVRFHSRMFTHWAPLEVDSSRCPIKAARCQRVEMRMCIIILLWRAVSEKLFEKRTVEELELNLFNPKKKKILTSCP